jgi:hypothetical protein
LQVRVLYIAGVAGSGSTILGRTVAAADGFLFGGGLHHLWRRGLVENRACGCGVPFHDCDLWRAVVERAQTRHAFGPETMSRIEETRLKTRRLPLAPVAKLHPGGHGSRELGRFCDTVASYYRAIAEVTGCAVIVDSSKAPYYGRVLASATDLDVRVAHLVRDPRATAFSWLRKHPRRMREVALNALAWNAWNTAAEALWRRNSGRYLRLRYEDFAARPREAVEGILCLLGEGGRKVSFEGDAAVTLGVDHSVSGNDNRFETGTISLRLDEEWRRGLSAVDRRLVTALTFPLLRRYGYRAAGRER